MSARPLSPIPPSHASWAFSRRSRSPSSPAPFPRRSRFPRNRPTSPAPNSPEFQTLQNSPNRAAGPRAGPPSTPKRGPECPGPGCGAARCPAAGSGAGGGVQGDFGKPAPAAAAGAAGGRRACTTRLKVCFYPNACSGGARDAWVTRCCSAVLGSSPCVRAAAPNSTAPICACHRDLLCAPATPLGAPGTGLHGAA